ncbi:MAG: DEAD/DEAH box helicase [Thermoleophilia bacterium]
MSGAAAADARAAVVAARALVAAAGQLRRELARARSEAAAAVYAVTAPLVRERLAALSVDRVNETTEGRVRVSALAEAGYMSVAQLIDADPHRLEALPGVGLQTARRAVAAARRLAEAVEDTTRLRLDADARPVAHTEVLAALWRARIAAGPGADVDRDTQEVLGELRGMMAAAEPAAGRVQLFFTRGERRRRALEGAAAVGGVLARPEIAGLPGRITAALDALAAPVPGAEVLWNAFAADAVAYNALLADVAGWSSRGAPVHGFLPDEVARRISGHPLDGTHLRASLRGYQAFGARFALAQGRAILGDEMGLGKTVQALAAMCHLHAGGERHFIVVCPASVLANWLREIPKHTHLTGHRVHGDAREAALSAWAAHGGVAVTTFDTARLIDLPAQASPALLVVDEAHNIKNPAAKRTIALRTWIGRASRVLLMTGTPMENRPDEFAALVGHVAPGLAARLDGAAGALGAEAFRAAVGPVYLRRNQVDVLDELPPRIESEDWVDLEGADADAYRDAVAAGDLMAMRRAAYAPGDPARSAKLERLVEIVEEAAEDGLKVVVFSFFLDGLDAVAAVAGDRAVGPLTGAVAPGDRQALVDEFTARPHPAVLVSQIQAGGVGLNIQAGSVVILTEPQWKPSSEEQAIARCHRMGQVRTVHVHRLLAEETVDELMREVLAGKSALFDDYARPSELADASPDATDVSDVGLAREVAERADVERRIVAHERARLGLAAGGVTP